MQPSDQKIKLRIVLVTAALALVGFFLEIGPVAGVFSLAVGGPPIYVGLILEFQTFGFLAYLALAASAAVGLHLMETEPLPREEPRDNAALQQTSQGEAVGQRVAVRPELHQIRMIITALGGFSVFKAVSLAIMWSQVPQYGMDSSRLFRLFEFGIFYVALGWFVLWQFLRWFAYRKKWVRLQAELIGGDVTRFIAVVILAKPVIFLVSALFSLGHGGVALPLLGMNALLHLALVAAAIILWYARPIALRKTVVGLLVVGAGIIITTLLMIGVERMTITTF